ncbi:Clavaminate synthase-like protein [Astrocystis sublimbata]|nr:Clavaminate synthase-like protein [Astrocystis sublimbata]
MPAPAVMQMSRSLRLASRGAYKVKVSRHGLFKPCRPFSAFIQLSRQQSKGPEDSEISESTEGWVRGHLDADKTPPTSGLPGFSEPHRVVPTPPGRYTHHWKMWPHIKNARIHYYKARGSSPLTVSRAWLRDACTCEMCVDPSSGQKNFASTDVPLQLEVQDLKSTDDGGLLVHWKDDFHTHDIHVSRYSQSLWARQQSAIPDAKPWSRDSMMEVSPFFSFDSFAADGSEYRNAMLALAEYGLIFLRDVPASEETVKDIASRLGIIQETFYGTTWDVRSKPNAENVAYTNSYLGLHQDLLYMTNVPRIQILHCLENTCEGGESLFCDSLRAVLRFRQLDQHLIPALQTRKVVYHYNKGDHRYQHEREVLPILASGMMGMYWSPPFQSPVQRDQKSEDGMDDYSIWHEAMRRLESITQDQENVYEYKMKPGECVIFDNRRVLHGRRAFDTSSGYRWLKGTYVDNDSFDSRLRFLELPIDRKLRAKNVKEDLCR